MAYTLPTFNLNYRIDDSGNVPDQGGLNWFLESTCQRYVPNKRDPDMAYTTYWGRVVSQFRLEPTDFYSVQSITNIVNWNLGIIECGVGDEVYFRVFDWDIMHQGFPNEYPVVWAYRIHSSGYPFQGATANGNSLYPPTPQVYGPP